MGRGFGGGGAGTGVVAVSGVTADTAQPKWCCLSEGVVMVQAPSCFSHVPYVCPLFSPRTLLLLLLAASLSFVLARALKVFCWFAGGRLCCCCWSRLGWRLAISWSCPFVHFLMLAVGRTFGTCSCCSTSLPATLLTSAVGHRVFVLCRIGVGRMDATFFSWASESHQLPLILPSLQLCEPDQLGACSRARVCAGGGLTISITIAGQEGEGVTGSTGIRCRDIA
mmetsp:Transcript_16451/g.41029  ORF Transcript_16451/g.41029 Transcript_16451/m.41029 type:complete len:224 (-) Transcript_16451:230-901(-)